VLAFNAVSGGLFIEIAAPEFLTEGNKGNEEEKTFNR
jgi:hypothetical protein